MDEIERFYAQVTAGQRVEVRLVLGTVGGRPNELGPFCQPHAEAMRKRFPVAVPVLVECEPGAAHCRQCEAPDARVVGVPIDAETGQPADAPPT